MTMSSTTGLHRAATADVPASGVVHDISPADAGWSYVGFADRILAAGDGFARPPSEDEVALIVLEGAADVRAGAERFSSLGSRGDVFEGPPPPVLLLEAGTELEISAEGRCRVAIASAPTSDLRISGLIEPATMHVETRGSGNTERRIHHLLPPAVEAGKLILFEVYTPGGNWSSYPPHKHDTEDPPREAYLEELYYYRFARPEGWAFARVYTADGSLDESFSPHDGDVVLVPRGYHPVGQPAGYDGYYLNVMAGPNRAWHFTMDPDHAWLLDWDPNAPR